MKSTVNQKCNLHVHTPENVQKIEMSSKTPAAFSQQLLKEDIEDPKRLAVIHKYML